jgi:hypothetical protein
MSIRHLAPIFILFLITTGPAAAQGYPGYPNTIMAPERGAIHHRAEASRRAPHPRAAQVASTPAGHQHGRRRLTIARGSSGSVLPTPLPRTPLIPPEGSGQATVHITPPEQSPTIVPGIARPVPNLPHGTESFQDRASRCAFQRGLYNVPGNMTTQYMGACLQ